MSDMNKTTFANYYYCHSLALKLVVAGVFVLRNSQSASSQHKFVLIKQSQTELFQEAPDGFLNYGTSCTPELRPSLEQAAELLPTKLLVT